MLASNKHTLSHKLHNCRNVSKIQQIFRESGARVPSPNRHTLIRLDITSLTLIASNFPLDKIFRGTARRRWASTLYSCWCQVRIKERKDEKKGNDWAAAATSGCNTPTPLSVVVSWLLGGSYGPPTWIYLVLERALTLLRWLMRRLKYEIHPDEQLHCCQE